MVDDNKPLSEKVEVKVDADYYEGDTVSIDVIPVDAIKQAVKEAYLEIRVKICSHSRCRIGSPQCWNCINVSRIFKDKFGFELE